MNYKVIDRENYYSKGVFRHFWEVELKGRVNEKNI